MYKKREERDGWRQRFEDQDGSWEEYGESSQSFQR